MWPLIIIVAAVWLFRKLDNEHSTVLVDQPGNVDRYLDALKAFYQTKAETPRVVFFAEGDCSSDGDNFDEGLWLTSGHRCTEATWEHPPLNEIRMMNLPNWKDKLAHEMLHQKLFEKYGDSDPQHRFEEWHTLLPQAIALVRSL